MVRTGKNMSEQGNLPPQALFVGFSKANFGNTGIKSNCVFPQELWKQVRLSRATLEFQVLRVPTGLKVFNSLVIYWMSFTKILGQRSLVSKTLCFQKKLSFNEFGTQEIVSHRFRETNNEKTIWLQKYFGSKKFSDLP